MITEKIYILHNIHRTKINPRDPNSYSRHNSLLDWSETCNWLIQKRKMIDDDSPIERSQTHGLASNTPKSKAVTAWD